MRSVRLLLTVSLLTGMTACTVQQVDPTADIPIISYQSDISLIMSTQCAVSGCHDGSSGELGSLLTYDDVMRYGGVEPGKPHNSRLYNTIRRYVGNVMPPAPNQPLSDEQIAAIYVWILQGAHNN